MTEPQTIPSLQASWGAEFLPYGPDETGEEAPLQIVESFGRYEAEYAAIQRRAAIMHWPQLGLIDLRGSDTKDFLHRLTTQNINALSGGSSVRSFQLNEKGRIVADMTIHHGDENTWLECDIHDVPALLDLYDKRLFTEDVTITDQTKDWTCLRVLGPASLALLKQVSNDDLGPVSTMPQTHHVLTLAGTKVTVTQDHACGSQGYRLFVRNENSLSLYRSLLDAAGYDAKAEADPDADFAAERRQGLRGRPVGWLAFNTARIEAGTPVFHIDFANDSIPGETGLLDHAVSFTKGCYLGQEIVARMQNLGHPKKILVGLSFDDERLPIAGSQVMQKTDDSKTPGSIIGGITSSSLSPLRGQRAVALAMMQWGKHQVGTTVLAPAEGELIEGSICPPGSWT